MLYVEILMAITGLWALVMGRIPSFLFGGKKYKYEGRGVRLMGIILLLPIPVSITIVVILDLFGVQADAFIVELFLVLLCGFGAIFLGRYVRQPAEIIEAPNSKEIQEQTE